MADELIMKRTVWAPVLIWFFGIIAPAASGVALSAEPQVSLGQLCRKSAAGRICAGGLTNVGVPAFAQLEDSQLKDVTEFLHLQVENYANRMSYQVANILVGDAAKGKSYFDSRCATCHSVGGDLAHVGTKFKPLDLQRRWISPERNTPGRAMMASVTTASGVVSGTLTRLDDFQVAITDASGHTLDFQRVPPVQVELKDPLAFHMTMIPMLKDDDIHNVTVYLEKQK